MVGTASASDVDAEDTHTYELTDSANGRFAIDSETGEITVADASQLDYEQATSHEVTVRATDADGATYDQALAEARRKSRYLAAYIKPTLAQSSEYPRKEMLLGILTFFLISAWGIAILIYYSVRDRR